MLSRFFAWTTQLNQTDPLAFAIVTVLTMATVGIAIAVTAEWLLARLAGHKRGAPERQPTRH